MEQDPDLDYVIPKEGSSLFLDSLVIPRERAAPRAGPRLHRLHAGGGDRGRDLPHHALLDAEPRGRAPCCPTTIREQPRHLPAAPTCWRALELIEDIGEATVLYDRLWTEVKTSR